MLSLTVMSRCFIKPLETKLLTAYQGSSLVVPSRNTWGNVNRPNPRGKNRPNRHWNPWNKRARAAKVMKIELPDKEFLRRMQRQEVTPAEIRAELKERGMLPNLMYSETPAYVSSTGSIFDEFVTSEGDGKISFLSKEGAKENALGVQKKGKSFMAIRKIRQYEEGFDASSFAETAQDLYIRAHQALAANDEDELHKLVTEKAYPELRHNLDRKTIRWSFLKSLEPPKVVQARTASVFQSANLYGQVTVRFNSQQTLAVYDRFGRLMHGSETVAKDVLEYVVFEKHLANVYGSWRLHGKIIPDWQGRRPASRLTYVMEEDEDEAVADEAGSKSEQDKAADEDGTEQTTVYDRFGKAIKRE